MNNELLSNINKIHTTVMGINRIKNNLLLDDVDVVLYCKKIILDDKCIIERKGKNWYCKKDNLVITVNAHSFTIITAHLIDK